MIFKNVAGQKLPVYAYNSLTGLPVTGDSANITCRYDLDGANSYADLTDLNPIEGEGGVYYFDLEQAETNGDMFVYVPVSATENVALKTLVGYTEGGVNVLLSGGVYSKLGNAGTATGLVPGEDLISEDVIATAVTSDMDANSTQLTAIVEDTGTTIPALIEALNAFDPSVYTTLDGETWNEAFTLMRSVLVGISNSSGTVFRDKDDTLDRVTATVDTSGNRTAITTNVTEV